ncbi:histidine kinase [Bacillus wiedmannii]|nr:histidine kinase [Bacillus wiedmannii]MCU5685698.1 histidine kinase [Bacillus wiedmannii]
MLGQNRLIFPAMIAVMMVLLVVFDLLLSFIISFTEKLV